MKKTASLLALACLAAGLAASAQTASAPTNRNLLYVGRWNRDNPADFADGVHPNDIGDYKAAARLAPLLKPLLGNQ